MIDLKVLIVEDEILIAEDLKDMLLSFQIKTVEMVHDKNAAIQKINDLHPDIVLLDIRMESETDGLEIGKYLKSNTDIAHIYITAHSDVAMVKEILKTQPAGYITKPIKKSDLFANLNLTISKIKNVDILKIKEANTTINIPFDTILYIKSESNYVYVYTTQKTYFIRNSLEAIFEGLDSSVFFRIHRSFVINKKKVEKYSKKEVFIENEPIPIAKSKLEEFEKLMAKY